MSRAELPRWIASLTIALAAHAAIAAAMLRTTEPDATPDPSGAILVELAPVAVAPAAEPVDVPPGPEQVEAAAAPAQQPVEEAEKPEQKAETQAAPEPPPDTAAPDAELAAAAPPDHPPPQAADASPAPATTAPLAIPPAAVEMAAAPNDGLPAANDSAALATWRTRIAVTLERNKRYPSEARARKQQGVAEVAFSIDRQGRVVASQILHGSGHPALDRETLELVRRAQPFPLPPAEMPGERVDVVVPIRFSLR
jgi:periplasmic protein TonB